MTASGLQDRTVSWSLLNGAAEQGRSRPIEEENNFYVKEQYNHGQKIKEFIINVHYSLAGYTAYTCSEHAIIVVGNRHYVWAVLSCLGIQRSLPSSELNTDYKSKITITIPMHENLPSQILVYRQINITLRRGHWGLLKTTKPLEKIIQNHKTAKKW